MLSKKLNLSKQLLKSILTIYILITFLVTAIHFFIDYKYTKTHIKDELKTIASVFEPSLRTALWDLNYEQVKSIGQGLMNMPLVHGVIITDPNNVDLISKLDDALSKEKMSDADLSHSFTINEKYDGNEVYLAKVTIYSDKVAIFDRIELNIGMILLNEFIKTMALIVLFVVAFKSHLEEPLQELTKKISDLKWENRQNRYVNVKFDNENELAVLQSKFNQLLSKISSEEDEKFKLSDNRKIQLEQEVKNRTKELEEANAKLLKLATTDALTKLSNRAKIDDELSIKNDNFRRYERVFSVIMMDIDFFKRVNDEHGHLIGDYILKTIGNILSENTRSMDVAGRWGGEEFLIICSETDAEGAYALAEKIRTTIEAYPFDHIGRKTASFGVAQISEELSLDALLKQADDCLYEAKNEGRNKTVKRSIV